MALLLLLSPLWARLATRRILSRRVAGRAVLTDDALCALMPAPDIPRAHVRYAWRRIGTLLHLDAGRLRPDDALESLRVLPAWVEGNGALLQDFGALYEEVAHAVDRGAPEPEPFTTVGDAVRYLARHLAPCR
ncbi:MAG TPA: hypothetical protein PLZ36_02395 [Armatimonadota bacterium]|nr:hypothetical protein [Armatimonadota bacterium]HOS42547.1 hypothetical protein [Armatimonadota bacterium]